MLMIMIEYEEPEIKEPGQKAAGNPAGQMEVPESSCQGAGQKQCSGK
jgi:hypothetical protein